jgi:2,3-bisphosphoglycerate-dependent phosphoglycerate mutase
MLGEKKKLPKPPPRRRAQLIPVAGFMLVAVGLAWFFESQATTTIIFVRHTDTASLPQTDDPPLSALGRRRAELLATTLLDVDVVAGLDAIYATEYRRTQETAAPLSARLDLPVTAADSNDVEGLIARILSDHKGKITLVVAHADTIALLIAELGGSKNVPGIQADEYGNLYIVTIPWFGKVKTLRLHYDRPWSPEGAGAGQ